MNWIRLKYPYKLTLFLYFKSNLPAVENAQIALLHLPGSKSQHSKSRPRAI